MMKPGQRFVFFSALTGFLVPLVMLAYYAISGTMAGKFYVALCPACIGSIALDNASTGTALIAWTLFCLFNAGLYATPGFLFLIFKHLVGEQKAEELTVISLDPDA